jgi:23S rRNA pseudouridine1911/1915/1917 synthase
MIEVLYEDNHLIAVNKPTGMLVQGDITGDECLLDVVKAYIKEKYQKPGNVFLGLIHRIDRPVSGVVVLAKTSKALERMNNLFKTREVVKTYWTVVEKLPEPESGTIKNFLQKNTAENKSFVTKKSTDGKESILEYKFLEGSDNYFLLEITPQTGRHHQIRAQLAHIGSPIKGDVKYGAKRTNKDGSIHLHARSLSFEHPITKEKVSIKAKVPKDGLWEYFENLRK